MRILLIRHGMTEPLGRVLYGRMPGVHLNEVGRKQVQLLAETLRTRYQIDEIVSSPLERTMETARFVSDATGREITIDESINEVDTGSWMGKTFVEVSEDGQWQKYNQLRSIARPPGGELITQVQTRGMTAIEKILERYSDRPDATAAVISHGDVIRALLMLFLGMPIDHIHRLEVAPASVSEILLGNGHPRVLYINQAF